MVTYVGNLRVMREKVVEVKAREKSLARDRMKSGWQDVEGSTHSDQLVAQQEIEK